MLFNQVNHNAPSRFLEEIPARLMQDEWAERKEAAFRNAPQPTRQRGYGSGYGLKSTPPMSELGKRA